MLLLIKVEQNVWKKRIHNFLILAKCYFIYVSKLEKFFYPRFYSHYVLRFNHQIQRAELAINNGNKNIFFCSKNPLINQGTTLDSKAKGGTIRLESECQVSQTYLEDNVNIVKLKSEAHVEYGKTVFMWLFFCYKFFTSYSVFSWLIMHLSSDLSLDIFLWSHECKSYILVMPKDQKITFGCHKE